MIQKLTSLIMAGFLSTTFLSGCTSESSPVMSPVKKELELANVPFLTFSCGSKSARLYQLTGPWGDRDFVYLGNEFVYAHGNIYFYGDAYDGRGGSVRGLYKHELEDGKIVSKTFVGKSDGGFRDKRTLAVSQGLVLFHQKNEKLGLCDGKNIFKGGSWKEDYYNLTGFADSDKLLLVKSPGTICTARLENAKIKDLKVIVQDAVSLLGQEVQLCPVYADNDAMFLSTPDNLVSFDRDGHLLASYDGLGKEHSNWAVTEHYIIQTSRHDGHLRIYERAAGKKIHDASITSLLDFEPDNLYSLGDDKILIRIFGPKYVVLDLGQDDKSPLMSSPK